MLEYAYDGVMYRTIDYFHFPILRLLEIHYDYLLRGIPDEAFEYIATNL